MPRLSISRSRTIAAQLAINCGLLVSGPPLLAAEYELLDVLQPATQRADDHAAVITGLAFQPGGGLLATAGDDHVIRLWDVGSGRVIASLSGHADWIRAVIFSGDGRYLASAAADGKLILWDLKLQKRHTVLDSPHPLSAVALSPDGQHFVATGFQTSIFTVHVESRKVISRSTSKCQDLRTVTISPDGKLMAGGGRDGNAYVWSTSSGQLLKTIPAHDRRIRAIVFSKDGRQLITGSEDRSVRVWNVEAGQEVMRLDSNTKVLALCLVGPHRVASAGSDNLIRIWDLKLGTQVARMKGHSGSIGALATDGERLASGSFDTTVRIWGLPHPRGAATALRPTPHAAER